MSRRWYLKLWFISVALIVCVTASSGDLRVARAQQPDHFKSEKEFASGVIAIEELLDQVTAKLNAGLAVGPELNRLGQEKDSLLSLDSAIRQRFDQLRQKLLDDNLPPVILDRHQLTVENHQENFQILVDNLNRIDARQPGAGLGPARAGAVLDLVNAARDHLKGHRTKEEPRLLHNAGLPTQVLGKEPVFHRIDDAEAFLDSFDSAPMVPSGPPLPQDTAATIDVQITQDIIDLASSLGNSPLEIHQHVRDNFRYQPYLGSRKGSRETLLIEGGNDYDLASLLIALMRAANIPARYVSGKVVMPIDDVMNWVGVEDAITAGSILATAGLDPTIHSDASGIVAASFDHVWVAAFVPYSNYRGIPNDTTGGLWVPLDPSFKNYDYNPAVDVPAAMGFDAETFVDNYISTFHALSPVELYLQDIETFVAANLSGVNFPDDVFRSSTIVPEGLGLLAGTLPYRVVSQDADFAEIPANKRYQIRFVVKNQFGATMYDHTANLPEIASKRVTISYQAATPADQATIDSFGDLYLTPPNLISLKPVLKIDGVTIVTGSSIGAGISHTSEMHFLQPVGDSNPLPLVSNVITAGTYQGIGIDTFNAGGGIFIPTADGSLPDLDGRTGEKLYRTAMGYLGRVDASANLVAQTMQVVYTTDVSEAIVENVIPVSFSFGNPVAWEWRGLVVDADRKIISAFSVTGDSSEGKQFMVLTGADASLLENRIFEDTFGENAVSTIKILELASDLSITICRITTSIAVDCPGLSTSAAVVSAINIA